VPRDRTDGRQGRLIGRPLCEGGLWKALSCGSHFARGDCGSHFARGGVPCRPRLRPMPSQTHHEIAHRYVPWFTSRRARQAKLLNGVLGVQQPGVVGSLSYMTPLGRGVNRNRWDWYGFGSANNSFWCCYGTTIEQFAKLGDSIYFGQPPSTQASRPKTVAAEAEAPSRHVAEAVGTGLVANGSGVVANGTGVLWVSQYIPSTLTWAAQGVRVNMTTRLTVPTVRTVRRDGLHARPPTTTATLTVRLTLTSTTAAPTDPMTADPTTSDPTTADPTTADPTTDTEATPTHPGRRRTVVRVATALRIALRCRVPGWATPDSTVRVLRDGTSVAEAQPENGTFYAVGTPPMGWQSNDVVELALGMTPRLAPLNDERLEYASVASIMLGPLLLAGITNATDELRADPSRVAEWVVAESPARAGGTCDGRAAAHGPWQIWGGRAGRRCGESDAAADADVQLIARGANRNYTLLPLAQVALVNYTAYFNVTK